MRIIFLDHDGVICLSNQWGSRKKTGELFDRFDPKAIKTLNKIFNNLNFEIVCSSDWRMYAKIGVMQEVYKERGIQPSLIDYTEIFDMLPEEKHLPEQALLASIRSREIMAWVESNKPEKWVAVDDLPLLVSNFVKTPYPSEGIKQTGVAEKILAILQ